MYYCSQRIPVGTGTVGTYFLDDGKGLAHVQGHHPIVLDPGPEVAPQLPLQDLPEGPVEHVIRQQLGAQPVQQHVEHLKYGTYLCFVEPYKLISSLKEVDASWAKGVITKYF